MVVIVANKCRKLDHKIVVIVAKDCRKLENKILVIVANNYRKLYNKIIVIVKKKKDRVIKLVHWGDEMWDEVENGEEGERKFLLRPTPSELRGCSHWLRYQREDW